MKITDRHVVTLNYTLTDNDGTVIDQAQDSSFVYLHGAQNIIPGLEKELADKKVGDKLTIKVSPEEGYGLRDDKRVEEVPREMFPEDTDIEPGMVFHAEGPNGEMITVTAIEVTETSVKIDSNHALAGIELNFDVEVMAVRAAEPVEIEHGHVHGPEGHQH
ncbi:MAG: peptidylprolyl isomerase [Gammaproteobacteria bacterium]|nr:peptidylprolyl isomerase [Gammaproteobacteria bacterium]MBL6999564.1 peptidylprolyl isomerase [Gammaproteobacteria bacterium]